MKEGITKFDTEYSRLIEQMAKLEKELVQSKADLKKQSDIVASVSTQSTQQKSQITLLEGKIAGLQTQKDQMEATLKSEQEQHDNSKKSNAKLVTDLADLQKKLADQKTAEAAATILLKTEMQTEIGKLQAALNTQTGVVRDKDAHIDKVKAQLVEANTQRQQLQLSLQSEQNQRAALEARILGKSLCAKLDFKKYEEIINYIQTWAKYLEEPSDTMGKTTQVLESTLVRLGDELQNADQPIREHFDLKDCEAQVVQRCQLVLDKALEERFAEIQVLIGYLKTNRTLLLKKELAQQKFDHDTLIRSYQKQSMTGLNQDIVDDFCSTMMTLIENMEQRIKQLMAWDHMQLNAPQPKS